MDQLPAIARHTGFRQLSIDALMHPHSRQWLGAITRLLSKEVAVVRNNRIAASQAG